MIADIVLKRIYLDDFTQGILSTNNNFRCVTLELPDLQNEPNISCIPEGIYEYFYRVSPANGEVLELKNVVNRTFIQIHVGNWVDDTVGCILVGSSFVLSSDNGPMVTNSGDTIKLLFASSPEQGYIQITG